LREYTYQAGTVRQNGNGESVEPVQVVVKAGNCPDCGAIAPSYTVKKGVQYRKCSGCGHRYKTTKGVDHAMR
jgi:transcription elongation factor Elf1